MSSESNDEYLSKVRNEIRAQAQTLSQRPLLSRLALLPRASGATADTIERDRLDYPIGALTDPQHRAFVEHAFRAILKRAPDEAEMRAQLDLLAAGTAKAEMLGNLRYSPEGRHIGTRIGGLLPRYALAKAGRVPLLGYLLQLGTTAAALPLLARHQRAADALSAARDHAATETTRALGGRIDELGAAGAVLGQRIDDLHAFAHELNVAREAQAALLHEVGVVLHNRVAGLEAIANTHAGRLDELAFLRQRVYAINHWSHDLTAAFARIEDAADQRRAEQGALAARVATEAVAADAARGPRNAAWANLLVHRLPAHATLIALASGRDWIDLLAARGLRPIGVDPGCAPTATPDSRPSNLERVAPQQFLQRSDDASVDGITVLAFPTLARSMSAIGFLREAQRVLRPGGTVLLAFAHEPVALAEALLGDTAPALSADLLQRALVTAGFVDVARADAADGSAALLARTAAS